MKLHVRSNRGSMLALAFVGLIPLMFAIGGMAVDLMHVNDERGALQRATDAGALAGAEDIGRWTGSKTQQSSNFSGYTTNEEPVDYALKIAELNIVDGRHPVTNDLAGTTITAAMLTQVNPDTVCSGANPRPTACRVTGTMRIRSLFAGWIGNWTQTVSTSSWAGATPINTIQLYFPVLVSRVMPDVNGYSLAGYSDSTAPTPPEYVVKNSAPLPNGATFTIGMQTGGPEAGQNSVWLFHSAKQDSDAIKFIAGVSNNAPNEPTISLNQTIDCDDGVKASVAADFAYLQPGMSIVMPVTNSPCGPTFGTSHQIDGFLALQVTSVDVSNQQITGTLSTGLTIGSLTGSGGTGNQSIIYTAKLIQ